MNKNQNGSENVLTSHEKIISEVFHGFTKSAGVVLFCRLHQNSSDIKGLAQDYGNSIANELESPQSCANFTYTFKPLI